MNNRVAGCFHPAPLVVSDDNRDVFPPTSPMEDPARWAARGEMTGEVRITAADGEIVVRSCRNGLYWVDFSAWRPDPLPVLPGTELPAFHGLVEQRLEWSRIVIALFAALATVHADETNIGTPPVHITPADFLTSSSPLGETGYGIGPSLLARAASSHGSNPSFHHHLVSSSTFHSAARLVEQLLQRDDSQEALLLVEVMALASRAVSDHSYGLGASLYWIAAEKTIAKMWSDSVQRDREVGSTRRLNSSDAKELMNGSTMTASMMTRLLMKEGAIDADLGRELHKARSSRNAWMHSLEAITSERALDSHRAVEALLSRAASIDLRFFPHLSIHG